MRNLIGIIGAEVRKIFEKKEFLLGILSVIIMGCGMVYGAYEYPDSFGIHNVAAFYGNFSIILILFLAAKVLGEEFDLKTATFIFTSKCSRGRIYTAKIISVVACCMVIGFFGGMLHNISLVICKGDWSPLLLVTNMLKLIGAYALYGFVAASGAVLLTTILRNTIMPFIYLIILYWVLPGILGMIAEKITVLKHIIGFIAFSFADDFIMYQTYTLKAIIVLLINGFIFYAASLAVVRKKDLC